MSGNQFIPQKMQPTKVASDAAAVAAVDVTVGSDIGLSMVAQGAVVTLFGLLPILFMPGLWATLGFNKTFFAIGISVLVVVLMSLMVLRKSKVSTILPLSLGVFWLVILAAYASGLLSGDMQNALRGRTFEPQTVGFLTVLAVVATIPLILQGSKAMSMRALALFGGSATLLLVFETIRLFFGAGVLSLGSFATVTITPIGSFNDLAIFSGLIIILSLLTLQQLPLRTWLQSFLTILIVLALFVLSVVNFAAIWIVVGFFGLLMLVYLLSRDTIFRNTAISSPTPRLLFVATVMVCLVSAVFVVAGEYAGGKVSEFVNVNYVEVRPSAQATVDIARSVYNENALFGAGPNRFDDVWRLYKDRSINDTIFWDTDFAAGSGFVPTLFINLGLLGGVLLVAFHLLFLRLGYRMFVRGKDQDNYWYYFGMVAFTGAVFLWGMSYVYVPGVAILLLAALFTGLTYVAAGALLPASVKQIPLPFNQRNGFFLMAVIIIIVSVSIVTLLTVGKQYVAQANFNKAQATATSVAEFEQAAFTSFGLYPDDRFMSGRARMQLASMTTLLGINNPSQEQQQQFINTAEQALQYAERAVEVDRYNPDNHAILAAVYSGLARAGISGAQDRAEAALAEAKHLDPQNPGYYLVSAQLAARINDVETAREEIAAALTLKRNFTEALYLSAQLDIKEGKTAAAIDTTRSIIRLEPQNPTRYYQLGVLLSAASDEAGAVEAFTRAIALDPQYANARYLLALSYLNSEQPNREAALQQLRFVQQTNADNPQLLDLIEQIETGTYQAPEQPEVELPVTEQAPQEGEADAVITDADVQSDLVNSVNTIPETTEEEQEATVEETAADETEPVPTE